MQQHLHSPGVATSNVQKAHVQLPTRSASSSVERLTRARAHVRLELDFCTSFSSITAYSLQFLCSSNDVHAPRDLDVDDGNQLALKSDRELMEN